MAPMACIASWISRMSGQSACAISIVSTSANATRTAHIGTPMNISKWCGERDEKFCGSRAFSAYDLPSHPAGADLLANKIREISSRRRYDDPVTQPPEIVGHKQTFEPAR